MHSETVPHEVLERIAALESEVAHLRQAVQQILAQIEADREDTLNRFRLVKECLDGIQIRTTTVAA